MWKQTRRYLIAVSVALNVAFVAIWITHAATSRLSAEPANQVETAEVIWCPLHRELDVSPQQWREIEPRLKAFQAAVGELCDQVDRSRSEVIEALAAEEPDLEAIRARQDEILATKRKMQGLVVAHLLAEKEILSADQEQRLFEMLRSRTGCAEPPMPGRARGGIGRVLQHSNGS
jgi:Spy/CpxP family protein refolding chaperone